MSTIRCDGLLNDETSDINSKGGYGLMQGLAC